MKPFLGENFLLTTAAAQRLYHEAAADMPIVDYHCHISPKEIYEDLHFGNIAQAWLAGDHYKWRLMRSNGVDEYYITGNAPDREKFQKFAETLPRAIGNPMVHWCHLELRNYFGYTGVLNGETAQQVWDLTAEKLQEPQMGVRGLIAQSNVRMIGTTDDPTDDLRWHKLIAEDPTIVVKVLPSFRPDKALNLDKPGWRAYIDRLAEVSGVEITGLDSLEAVLEKRIDYFAAHGCRASDHGLDRVDYIRAPRAAVEAVLIRALAGGNITAEETSMVRSALLTFCAAQYAKRGMVMQLHYNAIRNPNSRALRTLGPDTGFDCIGPNDGTRALSALLDDLYQADALPKTVLYSLDGGDNAFLDCIIGAFQGTEIAGKLQHGSAWWFNDHLQGMRDQLISLANLSILGNFIGMLTDSRSFLSYARHEYFRRILCELIGGWVENGEYPDDWQTVSGLVRDICANNALRYFSLMDE